MHVLSRYLRHKDDFSEGDLNTISWKYSMYMFASTIVYGNPIASPSTCQYMSNPILKKVVSTQEVNISIRLSTGIRARSSSAGYTANLFYYTVCIIRGKPRKQVYYIYNHYLVEMNGSLTDFSMKWAEFLTDDGDLPVSGVAIFTSKQLNE